MRFVSAKGEYAIMAVLALSLHTGDAPLQVKSIARKKSIPLRFLEQVMSVLKKKGLVESVRGPHGGYRLSRPPDQIRFGEVLQAVEGPLAFSDPSVTRTHAEMVEHRVIHEVWTEIGVSLNTQLNAISFEDLCHRQKEKEAQEAFMFHI